MRFTDRIVRFRWAIGLLAFLLSVLLSLHGSSIGMWNTYVPDYSNLDDGLIFGVDRSIRSDEWAVFTPMAISQAYNDYGLRNNIIRGTETDVFMVYGQPVRDWSIVFRPFQIGYLFLGTARGLSFYWVGKLIALLLVSFDFGMLITKKNKALSLAYSFLVGFAPVVQWWFSVNAFPDMLVYGQGILLMLSSYMKTDDYKKRILYALCISWLAGAYLLVMYPAWQIPFFYIFLFIGIWIIFSEYKQSAFNVKIDIPIIGGAVTILAICIALILYRSWDTIQAVTNSVYPGQRSEIGGMGFTPLLRYIGNLFLPFKDSGVPANVCEVSAFYDCFPFGLVFSLFFLIKEKKRDGLSISLLIVTTFLTLYYVLGFSPLISKLTLLSKATAKRTAVAVSYSNLLILFRYLALKDYAQNHKKIHLFISIFLCSCVMSYYARRWLYFEYYTDLMYWLSTAVLTIIVYFAVISQKLFALSACILSLVIGVTVNPIRTGLGIITNSKTGNAIQSIVMHDSGKWLAVSDKWPIGNYLIMYGAPTFNSTNTYINRDFWNVMDPERKYEDYYNRYAHIIVALTTETDFDIKLIHADVLQVYVPVAKLEQLGVKYLFSSENLEAYNAASDGVVCFQKSFFDPDTPYKIYVVEKDAEKNVLFDPALPIKNMITEEAFGRWIADSGICPKLPATLEADKITITGWAADFCNCYPFSRLYLKVGENIIPCVYGLSRKDVSSHFENENLTDTGFTVTFPSNFLAESSTDEISFIGISSDGKYQYKPVSYRLQ